MADDGSHEVPPNGLGGRDLIGLGGLLAGSVIVCTALGYVLDQAFDSTPAFTLVGIALGMVAGAVGFWLRVRSALRDPGSS
jgi:F0F1-type ATP synthase assembly protein I